VLNLSENARRRIAILGQVPPSSTLNFVMKSREKAKVDDKILSENLFDTASISKGEVGRGREGSKRV
jgi:hypothetical protein